jgi:hypothetical protein
MKLYEPVTVIVALLLGAVALGMSPVGQKMVKWPTGEGSGISTTERTVCGNWENSPNKC